MAQNYGTRNGRMVQMSPPWLQGSYGGSWQAGVGDLLDTYLVNTKTAVKLSMPSEAASLGDSNALDSLGQTAYIRRYFTDTDAEYAERIRNKWTTWGRAGAAPRQDGTGCNILDDLRGIGFGVTSLEYHDWPLISGQFYGAPISADVNGDPWWSQFWLVIDSFRGDDLSSGGEYDACYYDVDAYCGPVMTYNVDYIAENLKVAGLWKPANCVLAGIIFKIDENAAICGLSEYDSEAEYCSEGDDSAYYYTVNK